MKKTAKDKHIGIYIHRHNREQWDRVADLLPYFSCRVTILTSLSLSPEDVKTLGGANIIRLPALGKYAYASLFHECSLHKQRMKAISNFARDHNPDLFYIDESAEVAAFANMLGIPYVFTPAKESLHKDIGQQMACGLSLFNIALYESESEEAWYKKTPFYQKTKYQMRHQPEVSKKLFCLYLEEQICLKKEEDRKLMFLRAMS